jgi:hypothetical membrane protein
MDRAIISYMALGGLIGPMLFTTTTLICASLRPDYSHIHQFISELGATGTPNAALMNWIGFTLSGLLIAAFGLSLILVLPKQFLARTASVLILLFGVGLIVVGFFSCDEGCPRDGSLENNIHDQISGPIFLCAILGCFTLGFVFKRLADWRSLWLYSIGSAIVSSFFLIALVNSLDSYRFTGIWQRLLLLTLFLWFGIVGVHAYKLWRGRMPG